ncbi:hypothetical protein FHX68_0930 [Microbacterium lacticum]|uniref:Uncharacterized protein n=1 Tax=Microbacterium lacticum TaxID=33885 RepID=A0A543L0F5_9MICO|nr:hypothetical protein FHX68_0930 [Microbacterium lacticum]
MRFLEDAVEYHGFWASFWDLIWWFLAVFIFVAYLFALWRRVCSTRARSRRRSTRP